MSYIVGGKKLEHVPTPRVRRNQDGDVIPKRRVRTAQANRIRDMKRSRPEGTSLKEHAKKFGDEKLWLERKRKAK